MIRRLIVSIALAACPAVAVMAQETGEQDVELVAPESEQTGSIAHGSELEAREEFLGDEHAADSHDEAHGAETFLGIPVWIWKLANMTLFIWVLWRLLRKPFFTFFAGRKKDIAESLETAAERKDRAERMESEIRERLDKLEEEIEGIRQRAAEDGERISLEIAANAERDTEKVRRAARAEIEQRLRNARQELRSEAARLAADRAGQIVESTITDADRRKAFDAGIEQLEVKG
ncbi:MAG TPA: ATP synthase F0 subunit B [Thermoanaerobaculia bacterium]|nr:ATP synthase F0 subunit B [Thermoanaerobaculia bacterium]